MISLKDLNTFGIDCRSEQLIRIQQAEDLASVDYRGDNYLVLGGGSNVLFADELAPDILLMDNHTVTYQETDNAIHVTAQAGVNWHRLVEDSLDKGFSGLENLALIPGNIGAAPIQNIGAYGIELCDRFVSLTAWDFDAKAFITFNHDDCQFAYRDSYFKSAEGRRFCIWDVTLRLDQTFQPVLTYQGLTELSGNSDLSARNVFDRVCSLRRSKLPDPEVIGNAGSFFKNPIVSDSHYQELRSEFPSLVAYPQQGPCWKLAAAWLIDQAGFKGYKRDEVGVHDRQALVLVNRANATGRDIAQLAQHIQQTINNKFNVLLEPEVNIITAQGRTRLDTI